METIKAVGIAVLFCALFIALFIAAIAASSLGPEVKPDCLAFTHANYEAGKVPQVCYNKYQQGELNER